MIRNHCWWKSIIVCGVFFSLAVFISCKKEKSDANIKNKVAKIKLVSGDNQSGEFNTTLKDSLVVQVTDLGGKPLNHAPVYFATKNGVGRTSSSYVWTDSAGFAFVKLQLSCYASDIQTIAYLFDENLQYTDSVAFTAISVKPARWGRACGIDYTVDKIREYNNKCYAISQRKLYVSNDGGVNWDAFPYLTYNILDMQINSKGWMYILTENSEVYYSLNHGSMWIGISNGLLNTGYPLSFMVEDTVMYISNSSGLYRTRDNGQSWKKLQINGYFNDYSFINRHPSGKLYVIDSWDRLFMSADGGDNWSYINLSYQYHIDEISSFKIGADGFLYIGSGDATIAVVSPDTYTGETHSFYKSNSYSQSVNSIFIKNNVVYFTIEGSPDPGIYSSNGWKRIENGFYQPVQTLYLKDDGKFLIGSGNYGEGLYYE